LTGASELHPNQQLSDGDCSNRYIVVITNDRVGRSIGSLGLNEKRRGARNAE
jgi:hypothetical protein